MANYRQIHTQIWRDDWFSELNANEKLLFIYLFSNDSSSLTGLYKIALRVMAFETGLDPGFIRSTLEKFELSGRVIFRDNIIWVVHMWRYHSNASPKVRTRIENDLSLIPEIPIKQAYRYYQETGTINLDTVSIRDGYPIVLTNLILSDPILSEINQPYNPDGGENVPPKRPNIFKLYEQNIGTLTPLLRDELIEAERVYPEDWVDAAFKTAVEADARNWRYIRAILENRKAGKDKPRYNGGNGKGKRELSQDEARAKYAQYNQTRISDD